MTDPTVASVFLRILKKHGIRHVFGVPTIQIAMMQDGFGRDPWFEFYTTRHEESLGHIANGVAKTSGHVALCFATVGTGVANMLPGVAAAGADRRRAAGVRGRRGHGDRCRHRVHAAPDGRYLASGQYRRRAAAPGRDPVLKPPDTFGSAAAGPLDSTRDGRAVDKAG